MLNLKCNSFMSRKFAPASTICACVILAASVRHVLVSVQAHADEQGKTEPSATVSSKAGHSTRSLNSTQSGDAANYTTVTLHGRAVWMAAALKRRFDISSVPEARQRLLALETSDGTLHPIVEDVRGRSFRTDERLRDIDLELIVRRYNGSPMIRIVRVYERKKDGKYLIDYWCDLCAISTIEKGPCACCQEPCELRRRRPE